MSADPRHELPHEVLRATEDEGNIPGAPYSALGIIIALAALIGLLVLFLAVR